MNEWGVYINIMLYIIVNINILIKCYVVNSMCGGDIIFVVIFAHKVKSWVLLKKILYLVQIDVYILLEPV